MPREQTVHRHCERRRPPSPRQCAGGHQPADDVPLAGAGQSRTIDPASADTLTAQELEIARLAADGLTNRQIGERLFLSHRTVGAHLYRLYPKLGVASRAALHTALADRGLDGS